MSEVSVEAFQNLENENKALKEQLAALQARLDWLLRQVFGGKSEKIFEGKDDQMFFGDFEKWGVGQTAESVQDEQAPADPEPSRKKVNRNGQDEIRFPEHLPEKIITIDLPEEEKVCKDTGVALVKIGEEVSIKLAYSPGSYFLKKIIRLKYAHPILEEQGVLCPEMPCCIFPKCTADDSLLADVLVKKYADHLPLYRISEILSRENIGINRKLLSQWVIRCGVALTPLYNEMVKQVLASGNVYIDETPINVQSISGVEKGYMWTIVGGNGSNPPYRIYNFREDRSHQNAIDLLQGFKGYMHSDKYGAYVTLSTKEGIVWCPCWVHIRRHFFEAQTGDPEFRLWILRKIRYLYMFEKIAWMRSPEERLRIRQEKEIPIIDEIIAKVQVRAYQGDLLPKSQLMKAFNYFFDLIPHLKNYTQHAHAHIDNNVAERAIRPLAIGRKNWLFFGSQDAGQVSAIIFSLIQTCRGLGINPREYLENIFGRLLDHSANKLHELLPDQWLVSQDKATVIIDAKA